MSKYITILDDENPVLFVKGQPWANLTQIKQSSWLLQEICDVETYVENGKTYIKYTVKA